MDDEEKRIVERLRSVGEMTKDEKSESLKALQEVAKRKHGRWLTSKEIHKNYGLSESWVRKYMPPEMRAKPNMARYMFNNPQFRKKAPSLAKKTGIHVKCNECDKDLELVHLGSGHKVEPVTDDSLAQAS